MERSFNKTLLIKRLLPWQKLLLTVLSGIMLSLPWLGFPGWLLFTALLPLLLLDDYYAGQEGHSKSISFWKYPLLAFIIWNVLTTWWIVHATATGAFVAIFLNSLLMSLVFLLAHFTRRHSGGSMGYLAYVVFWIAFEYAHYHWEIEWPWLTLGNGFANNIRIIQWYEYTGTLGGTLWVWLVNIFLYFCLKQIAARVNMHRVIRAGLIPLIIIFAPSIWSSFRYHHYEETGTLRKVLIVQPNIDPYSESHDDWAVNEKLLKFIRLTENHMTPDINYIVGPETVFEENWDESNLLHYPAFRELSRLTNGKNNCALVIGASTFRIYDDGDQIPVTARHSRDGLAYDFYNAAIYTDNTGGYQVYHKSILVPGVEKMPFRKYLKFLDSFIINLGGTTGSLGIQTEPTNFISPGGDQIAPAICYESVFGGYIARFVHRGAGAIFVITNDGWWKDTPGYRQHFSFARLRAVETRRSIVRAANTGISGFISQRGEILQHSSWWEEDALKAEVKFNDTITFFVKYGDYIARISVFLSLLLILNLLISRLIKIKNPHQL